MNLPATVKITPWRKKPSDKITKTVEVPEGFTPPVIYNCGMGTDSLHAIHEAYRSGIKPDLVMFADTGAEKKRTYEVVEEVRNLLRLYWDMELTVVSRTEVYPLRPGGHTYTTITDNCLDNKTLPSLAYNMKGCSVKWKAEVMDRWIEMYYEPAMIAWALDMKVTKIIGYDASAADKKRSKIKEDARYRYEYPIRDAGQTRVDCIASIEKAYEENGCVGQPGKSACFFCPASKTHELVELYQTEPDKLAVSLLIENTALEYTLQTRDRPVTTFGLGGNGTWNWNFFLAITHPELLAELDGKYDTGQTKRQYIFHELKKRAEVAQAKLYKMEPVYAQWRDNEAKDARRAIKLDHDATQVAAAHAFLEGYKALQAELPQLRTVAKGLDKTSEVADKYKAGVREEVSGGGF